MCNAHDNIIDLYYNECKFSFLTAGLTLELFAEQNEYIGELSESVGMHVVVHDNGEMPFPQDLGVNIAPRFKTSIGIKRVSHMYIITCQL